MMAREGRDPLLRELSEWHPPGGVLSVYVDADPGDRGQGWRIALRGRLGEIVAAAPPHGPREAVEVAARRVLERFPEDGPPPPGRGHAGFVQVAERPREVWRALQLAPRRAAVVHADRAYLHPLVALLDRGASSGLALVSAERIRVLEWSLAELRSLDDWEIVLWSRDWRERKARRVRDPARAQGTTAAGRDQFDQRLEANRRRFLHEAGQRLGSLLERHPWRYLVAFGDEEHLGVLAEGLGPARERLREEPHNLISAPEAEVAERAGEAIDRLNRERQAGLVRAVEEAIGAARGAVLGPRETLEALTEGRVRHVIFDADLEQAERLTELAIATGAEITPLEGGPAGELERHEGAVALLRY